MFNVKKFSFENKFWIGSFHLSLSLHLLHFLKKSLKNYWFAERNMDWLGKLPWAFKGSLVSTKHKALVVSYNNNSAVICEQDRKKGNDVIVGKVGLVGTRSSIELLFMIHNCDLFLFYVIKSALSVLTEFVQVDFTTSKIKASACKNNMKSNGPESFIG